MSAEDSKIVETSVEQNDEWIVQSKPRRLVPQHSLSRQDLEADKSKVAPVVDTKKKVIRFTKEEMMTFRQSAKILGSMTEMTEVVSLDRLNPVCFERFEPEDVIRIWNTDKTGPGSKGVDAGRGRGRGKPRDDQQSGEHVPGDWSTAQTGGHSSKGGLWDDGAPSGGAGGGDGMDLSDFAAMALKFRSEMEQMKLTGDADGEVGGGVDMMTLLASEQSRRAAGGIEDEDEELPDWANDDAPVAAPQPAAKRSLLLDTLNVKRPAETPAAPAVQQHSAASNYSIGGGLDLSLTASVHSSAASSLLTPPPPPLLRVEPNEWMYTDPQGQVQGPFEHDNMRQWHEAGYFNAELPIKLRHWQRFHAFHTVFADLKNAFLTVPQEPGSGSLILNLQQQQIQQQQALARQQQLLQEEQQRKEQERLALEARQRQAQLEAAEQQRKQIELQRQQQEAQRQAQLAHQQQQAQQILLQQQQQQLAQQQAEAEAQRALLEQQRQQQLAAQQQAAQQNAAPASPVKPATVAPWANNKPGPNRGQDLASIQNEEAAAREAERKKAAAAAAVAEQTRAKGWTAPAATGSALSLAEIQAQEEEARQRQQAEAARNASAAAPATTNMSSQLKNLLGVRSAPAAAPVSTGPAWGNAAAPAAAKGAASLRDIMQQENTREDEGARPAVAGGRKPTSWAAKAGSTTFSAPEPAVVTRVAAPAPAPVSAPAPAPVVVKPAPKAAVNKEKEKSSFGGKDMSKDMADWCAAQLKRINGSDDLTLAQFCMSLESAAEIRETLSSYLGSSPAVTNFATEFIKYKETGKRAADTTASAGAGGSGGNNNNPSNFVSANKKKGKAPGGK